jgi:RNA recognition motif-containing protein
VTFKDHETALSAVRNLNGTDVGGRPLRIDLADSDPFLEGKTTVRGELLDGGYPGPSEPRSRGGSRNPSNDPESFLASLPPGKVTLQARRHLIALARLWLDATKSVDGGPSADEGWLHFSLAPTMLIVS